MQLSTPQQTAYAAGSNRAVVTVFLCANCGRDAVAPSESNRQRQALPQLDWPFTVCAVVVPCVGRLQPEHVLKVFEAGADAAVVVACEEDNCHYHEGSRRCHRRVEYVGRILEDVGLGANRILLTHLAGSARQDLALETRANDNDSQRRSDPSHLVALRHQILAHVAALPPDPIHRTIFPETLSSVLDDHDESED